MEKFWKETPPPLFTPNFLPDMKNAFCNRTIHTIDCSAYSLSQRSVWNKLAGLWEGLLKGCGVEITQGVVSSFSNSAFWPPPSHSLAVVPCKSWAGETVLAPCKRREQNWTALCLIHTFLWQSCWFSVLSFTSSSKTLIPEADYSWILQVYCSPLLPPNGTWDSQRVWCCHTKSL